MKTQEQKCANTVQANTYGHKYTKTLEQKYANTVQAYVDTNIRRRKNKNTQIQYKYMDTNTQEQ